ncbi:MAG: radical SAM protein [Anaerolineales bacterium]|nr:radical SAM protein [Anaerolineales bacterium]
MSSKSLSIDVDAALEFIEEHLDRRQVNKIQHSFPSPRFWSEKFIPVQEVIADRHHLAELDRSSPVNLYIGSPYCIKTAPDKCGYCLFPVEVFAGNAQLEVYFDYLKKEVAMYKEAMQGQELGAVYFGGGTANLYKAEKYPEMMGLVRELFPEIKPSVDLTLEGLPQLFSYDKIQAISEAGFNRISVGVQQINERLNSFSGRRQTTQHVQQTLQWAKEFGLACNFDLIFGWPQQTVATMVEDLETVVSWGVYDITHYELNVGGPTDFALNRFHELPSTLSNLEMYRTSRDLLKSHGYEQITAYNFRKPGDPNSRPYEEGVTRRFDSMNTVGLGYAAITFFGDSSLTDGRNWSYINWRDLAQYKLAIDEGRFPVECGFRHEAPDYQISMIWRNLFGLEIDREEYHDAFDVDVYEQFAGVWTALQEYDFVEVTPQKIKLVGDGPFYTPLVQTLLAEARYSDLRSRMVAEASA